LNNNKNNNENLLNNNNNNSENNKLTLSQKNDLIIWLTLSKYQIEKYKNKLSSKEVNDVLNKNSSALVCLTRLKQICDHPYLLLQNFDDFLKE
jgi:hypothetical protein